MSIVQINPRFLAEIIFKAVAVAVALGVVTTIGFNPLTTVLIVPALRQGLPIRPSGQQG